MTDQPITINLPQSVYERLKRATEQVALSAEDVFAQSISLALPALESDLPVHYGSLTIGPCVQDKDPFQETEKPLLILLADFNRRCETGGDFDFDLFIGLSSQGSGVVNGQDFQENVVDH